MRRIDVELRHLRYFVAIAEERSFTRASERLWVAQPGLSTQIRRVEEEIGAKLFERHTRGVDLTPAGQLFLDRARVALAAADAAAATGHDLETGVTGHVKLGVASEAHWHFTSNLLQRFGEERPGVELTMLEGYGGTLWRELRDGRLDAVLAPAGHAAVDLRTLVLGSEPWVALVGAGHPLAGIGPLPAEELDGRWVAVTGHRDGRVFDSAVGDLLAGLGVTAELVRAVPGPGLYAAVARNEVVALTTAPGGLPAGMIARTLDPGRALSFELLWRDEAPPPSLTQFISLATAAGRTTAPIRSLAAVA
jgi:DNA-binding transcriptional LysR family regulator